MSKKIRIPKFKSVKEEALFWDTHDVGDFVSLMKPVKVKYSPNIPKEAVMTLRLSPSLKKAVEHIAQRNNLPTSTLVRSWVVENVREAAA